MFRLHYKRFADVGGTGVEQCLSNKVKGQSVASKQGTISSQLAIYLRS